MAKSKNVGSDNGRAKLNEEAVSVIRVRFASGISSKELAADYRVSYRCIMYCVRRHTWKHVVP